MPTDIGQIIDPIGLELKSTAAGVPPALTAPYSRKRSLTAGRVILSTPTDYYKWRTFAELPVVENKVLETPFPSHRFHAIGIGEITNPPGPSAALMAVSNAVGDVALPVSCDSRSSP